MRHNLSEINKVITDRRTIYPEQFSDTEIDKDIIVNLLKNASYAPSHGMTQPWCFKVFKDKGRQVLASFLGDFYTTHVPKELFLESKYKKLTTRPLLSPVVIAVGMKRDPNERIEEIEEIEAVACAIQNMHLTATAYGIGAFWATPKIIYNPKINTFFDLAEKDKLLGLFFIGYPKIEWPEGKRKSFDQFTQWQED